MKRFHLILLLAAALPLAASPESDLRAAVAARYQGDRTGVCIAAALVGTRSASAIIQSDPDHPRPLDAHGSFEIGNISKSMLTALVVQSVQKGELSLDDPLAKLLPAGTRIPDYRGAPITLGQMLDHRSGLPALPGRMQVVDEADPYRTLSPDQLLGSLADVTLEAAPGSRYRYSTFAMMLLSSALARHQGQAFRTLIGERLFKPLAMDDAHLAPRTAPGLEVQGHDGGGHPAGPWHFPEDLAGGGGVRASLSDMIRFAEGALGIRNSSITPALVGTLVLPSAGERSPVVLNWRIVTWKGRWIYVNEGITGGCSSFLALDPDQHQAVVLLADTALGSTGGLEPMGLSLLDATFPGPGLPHRSASPGVELLDRMAGHYLLQNGPHLTLRKQGQRLYAQLEEQPAFELGFDSAGDFYALDRDTVIHPIRTPNGDAFTLRQGGGHVEAERLDPVQGPELPLDAKALEAYAGDYLLAPGFTVTISARGTQLFAQGTGQPEVAVLPARKDVFVTWNAGAEFSFTRNGAGRVKKLTVRQNGQTLSGNKR